MNDFEFIDAKTSSPDLWHSKFFSIVFFVLISCRLITDSRLHRLWRARISHFSLGTIIQRSCFSRGSSQSAFVLLSTMVAPISWRLTWRSANLWYRNETAWIDRASVSCTTTRLHCRLVGSSRRSRCPVFIRFRSLVWSDLYFFFRSGRSWNCKEALKGSYPSLSPWAKIQAYWGMSCITKSSTFCSTDNCSV